MKTLNPIIKIDESRNALKRRIPALPIHFCIMSFEIKTVLFCFLCMMTLATAFGQINYSNETNVADNVKQMLYWSDAQSTNKNVAAFRYKVLLYTNELGGVRANTPNMINLYGENERDRSHEAEQHLKLGLENNPSSVILGGLLLDIYYDRAVAENIFARNAWVDAEVIPFDITPVPPNFVIDSQISAYVSVLSLYENAFATYAAVLTNQLNTGTSLDGPLGYRVFRQRVPERSLTPGNYLSNGVPTSVIGETGPLFSGYKDLVLLYGILRDQARVANSLTRLYIARGWVTDLADAKTLVTRNQRYLFLHGNLLRGIFPDLDISSVDPASGLAEAESSWQKELSELEQLRQLIEGEANVLGFAPDFLMLIGKQSTYFDSFDSYKSLLDPGKASSRLKLAMDALADARDAEEDYHGFQEQLTSQLEDITDSAGDRLSEIVGEYPYPGGGDDTPQEGSEAWLQQNSIEIAKLQIERNKTEIANLKQEIQIEIDRRAQEEGINNAIASVQIDYGNKQAGLTESIGHIEAAQKLCDAAAEAAGADWTSPWSAGADLANGVAQAAAEEMKGQLNAEKERLGGQEAAEITSLNDDLLDINSKALIKNLWLRMNTLAIDSQEAALQLTQERGRLSALAREKEQLEVRIAESDASLSGRYFADPSHRLNMRSEQVRANLHFTEARKWLFFMMRALEYKWNETFETTYPGNDGWEWNSWSVFELRNAEELESFYNAMVTFDDGHTLIPDDYYDWFSIRENFFGYIDDPSATYADPVTKAPVDAIQAFRSELSLLTTSNPGYVTLEFSTVRSGGSSGTFFRGPRFNPDTGGIIEKGTYLDKIEWMKVNLPGDHPSGVESLGGSLRYGGTSYIRNPEHGGYDPLKPDRLTDEFSSFSSRFWFGSGGEWQFTDEQTATITMTLSEQERTPPSVQEINVFKERSVATSKWTLLIPIEGAASVDIDNLNDVEIEFFHQAFTRQ
ncbi:hypothetical protein P4C99_01990 [Pontiellaceae bacterium B1224]|nr:hypothetical protein [Pontiellaceae bacterium B1224]